MELSGHLLDRSFGYVIILLIPIYFKFFKNIYSSTIILGLLLCLSFSEGVLQLLGVLDPSYNRLLREVLLLLGFITVSTKAKQLNLPAINILLPLLIICFMSFLINNSSYWQLTLFVRRMAVNFITLYYVANINISLKAFKSLKNLIIGLFLIQIPISIIKFMQYGITENYIGSVSTIAGSLTTLISLVAISYLLSLLITSIKIKYIILIFLFIIFSAIGAKRAIFIFLPIFVFLTLVYSNRINIKRIILLFLLSIFSLLFIQKASSILNLENKFFGTYNLKAPISYTLNRMYIAKISGKPEA